MFSSYWLGGSSERLHLSMRHPYITGRLWWQRGKKSAASVYFFSLTSLPWCVCCGSRVTRRICHGARVSASPSGCWQVPMDSWGRPFPGWPGGVWADVAGCWCRSLSGSPCPTGWPWWRRFLRWLDMLPRTMRASPPRADVTERATKAAMITEEIKCWSLQLCCSGHWQQTR